MSDQDALRKKIPSDAFRVLVTDEYGKSKYKAPSDLLPSDQIMTKRDGVTPVTMAQTPGRRKNPVLLPTTPKVAEMIRAKEKFIDDDDLFNVISKSPDGETVLDHVMKALAEEAASLGFERVEAERQGNPTSQISLRRVNALKAVGDSWLKRKEQSSTGAVDMESPQFIRLFSHITDTFKDALVAAGERPEMIDIVFTNLSKLIEDPQWTMTAHKKMKEDR